MRSSALRCLAIALLFSSCASLKLAKPKQPPQETPLAVDVAAAPSEMSAPKNGFDFQEPEKHRITKSLNLWATYYRIHVASPHKHGVPLIGANNTKLGVSLTEKDWCEAALEGTVSVTQNQKSVIYNYLDHKGKAQTNCNKYYGRYLKPALIRAMNKTRFVRAETAYGYGVKDWQLAPYRTIAVDQSVIPYGSLVYIPSARGIAIELPTGERVIHDGYFFAGDTGGAIKQNHIDVFAGFALENPFPEFVKNSAKKPFRAYLINDETIHSQLATQHQKPSKNPL